MEYKISKFWTRIGALIIDSLIVGVFGFILGLIFEEFFISIGTLGLLIGLLICIIYFTIGYSYLTKGKTIGKRAVNIQVVTKGGNFLTLEKSFLRALILSSPFFIINLRIPGIEEDSLIFVLKNLLFLIAIIGIVLIYIFNITTRQTLHDFAANSIVTETREQDHEIELKKVKKTGFIIYGIIAIILIGLTIFNLSKSNTKSSTTYIVYNKLNQLKGVIRAGASDNTHTFYGKQKEVTHSFNGVLWVQEIPLELNNIEESEIVKKAVRVIIENTEDISEFDYINITLIRGFNIGIAKKTRSYNVSKSPKEWKSILNLKNSA